MQLPTTYRVYIEQPLKGRNIWHLDIRDFNFTGSEHVEVTACEYNPSAPVNGGTERLRFVGLANVWVSNISPLQSQVFFVINVDWGSPVYVSYDVNISLPPPSNQIIFS